MTLEEYMEELYLMEKQYGQEEELYPLINILLRQSGSVTGLSLRDVHNASITSDKSRKILYGLSSFPDLVILDKNFDKTEEDNSKLCQSIYGCIEVKHGHDINTFINTLGGEKKTFKLNIVKEGKIKLEIGLKAGLGKGYRYTYKETPLEYKIIGEENVKQLQLINIFKVNITLSKDGSYYSDDINLEITNDIKQAIGNIEQEKKYLRFRIKRLDKVSWVEDGTNQPIETNISELSQLLGEILFYKQVIYTDGLSWHYFKYFKLEEKENNLDDIIQQVVLNDNSDCVWYSELNEPNMIIHEKIGDLNDIYERYKDAINNKNKDEDKNKSENENKSKDEVPFEFLSKDYEEWKHLLSKLASIPWKPKDKETQNKE